MHRIDTPTAQVDKFGAGKNGFTRGNPQTGVPATALDDDYFDAVQEELAGVVEAAGFALNKANRAQLLAAIQHLITLGIPDLKDASLTQKGIVQLSNATNSTSQVLAATPKAVSDLGNLLLKITNNLSEIKDAGPAAVAQTLLNLSLGDAAKRSVGTGVNQIPDMSSFISSFAQNGYFKLPGKLIIQWGEVTGSTTATVPANFPIPFPNALLTTALAIDLVGPSYATLQNQTALGISVNTWNSAGNRAALAIRYIAIGW
ncbi:phage tail protein [Yersinia enterocolitica]|uniref:phage tail protein n=1 Tax=Yersinia enterocolitica TaxID=630 RepID=UPI003D013D8D